MSKLPVENFYLLAYVFLHAQMVVSREVENKMGVPAIGILLQAILSLSKNEIRIFLLNASDRLVRNKEIVQLFSNVDYKPYILPKTLDQLRQKLPETERELKDEILKQERLIDDLHGKVLKSRADSSVPYRDDQEQEMWNVQMGITLLKRELKSLQSPSKTAEPTHNGTVNPTPDQDISVIEVTALNSALLEKQLLAVQQCLKEEVVEEKRKIALLLSQLRDINGQASPATPKPIPVHTREDSPINMQRIVPEPSAEQPSNDDLEANERIRDDLLSEIIRLRNLCAQLRARLEQDMVALKNMSISNPAESLQANPTQSSLLVTRF